MATRKPRTKPVEHEPLLDDPQIDEFAGYDYEDMVNTAEHDFLQADGDPKLAALTREMFSTKVGKLRKAVLTPKQAVALSRAWAFAAMTNVPEVAALADMLADTTVSIKGKGLHQMVTVMSARMQAEDDDGMKRLGRNLGI